MVSDEAQEHPGFYDLMSHAETGLMKRALTRYFTTKNYQRSLKIHQMIGSPLIKKWGPGLLIRVFSGRPLGRLEWFGGNYRMGIREGKVEGALGFAYRGSVLNEAIHTAGVLSYGITFMDGIGLESNSGHIANGVLAVNAAMVAVQRYNRARMVRFADQQLRRGYELSARFESWSGIDHRAAENYQRATVPGPVCITAPEQIG